jgi:isopenicillin-N epimerase
VTEALNIISHSLDLGPGDEVLSTTHEYGAIDRMWRFLALQRGFSYITQEIGTPLEDHDQFITQFWKGVNPNTRVIFLSHISSPTALVFPIEELISWARKAGIITVIDGAHAPGQISLRFDEVGADFYAGNLHKWLCAPKGAGFLYARPDRQSIIQPLVVSWGYDAEIPGNSKFIDLLQWSGTRDIAAFLSVPDAIQFQKEHQWELIRKECHELVNYACMSICSMFHTTPLAKPDWNRQFCSIPVGRVSEKLKLKQQLYDSYRVEVPVINWQGMTLIRVSVQGYNTEEDIRKLIRALEEILGK